MGFLTADYHTHTVYSKKNHAKGTILENAEAAKSRGLSVIGITDHGYNHRTYAVRRRDYDKMRREANEAEKKTGVKILLGVEANITSPDGDIDVLESDLKRLDIIVMGYHRLVKPTGGGFTGKYYLNNLFREMLKKSYYAAPDNKKFVVRNTDTLVKAVHKGFVDILAHPNSHFRVDLVEAAKACAATNTYFELNNKGLAFGEKELEKIAATGVRFVLSSDAHKPSDVGSVERVAALVRKTGLESQTDNIDGKTINYKRQSTFAL